MRITQEIREEVFDYRCPICKKAFDRLPDFKQHVGLRKMANGKFKQQLCNANTPYTLAEWGEAIEHILSSRAGEGEAAPPAAVPAPAPDPAPAPAPTPTPAPASAGGEAEAGPSSSGQGHGQGKRRIEVRALPVHAPPAKHPRAEALAEYRRLLAQNGFEGVESDAQEEKAYFDQVLPFLEQERAVVETSHARLLRRLGGIPP